MLLCCYAVMLFCYAYATLTGLLGRLQHHAAAAVVMWKWQQQLTAVRFGIYGRGGSFSFSILVLVLLGSSYPPRLARITKPPLQSWSWWGRRKSRLVRVSVVVEYEVDLLVVESVVAMTSHESSITIIENKSKLDQRECDTIYLCIVLLSWNDCWDFLSTLLEDRMQLWQRSVWAVVESLDLKISQDLFSKTIHLSSMTPEIVCSIGFICWEMRSLLLMLDCRVDVL